MRVLIFLAALILVSCSKQDIEISQGGGLSSQALKEKTVVLNIWADWCPPCIVEMPYFNKLNEQEGIVVLGFHFGTVCLRKRGRHGGRFESAAHEAHGVGQNRAGRRGGGQQQ